MLRIVSSILMAGLMACHGGKEKEENSKFQRTEIGKMERKEDSLHVELFNNADSSIGYRIKRAGKDFIYQPNIPAVAGTSGFSCEKEARKVADLMIHKMNQNIMPPGISMQELDSLGVHY